MSFQIISKRVDGKTYPYFRTSTPGILAGDPYWQNVSLYIPGTGAAGASPTDVSLLANVLTLGGSPVVDLAQSKFGGGSINLSNGANYFRTAASSLTNLLTVTGTWTFEVWAYPLGYPQNGTYIGDFDPTGTTYSWGIGLSTDNDDGTHAVTIPKTDAGGKVHGTTAVSLNTWHHIAVSVNSGAISIFLDGNKETLVGNTTFGSQSAGTGRLNVGAFFSRTTNAYLSHWRLTKNVARYSASFAVPTSPYTAF